MNECQRLGILTDTVSMILTVRKNDVDTTCQVSALITDLRREQQVENQSEGTHPEE
jgi:hypothetical protein